jgi:hypothetical protein
MTTGSTIKRYNDTGVDGVPEPTMPRNDIDAIISIGSETSFLFARWVFRGILDFGMLLLPQVDRFLMM